MFYIGVSPKNSCMGGKNILEGDKYIQFKDCSDTLKRAKKFLNDAWLGKDNFMQYRHVAINMVRKLSDKGYLTKNQLKYLNYIVEIYDSLVSMNEGFDKKFVDSTISFIEEVRERTAPYTKKNKSLQGSRSQLSIKSKEIKEGKYFWDFHIKPVRYLLESIKEKKGIEFKDLEKRADELIQKVTLERRDYKERE